MPVLESLLACCEEGGFVEGSSGSALSEGDGVASMSISGDCHGGWVMQDIVDEWLPADKSVADVRRSSFSRAGGGEWTCCDDGGDAVSLGVEGSLATEDKHSCAWTCCRGLPRMGFSRKSACSMSSVIASSSSARMKSGKRDEKSSLQQSVFHKDRVASALSLAECGPNIHFTNPQRTHILSFRKSFGLSSWGSRRHGICRFSTVW